MLYFTNWACAYAHWAAKRSRNIRGPGPIRHQIDRLRCLAILHMSDPPVRKAPRAVSLVVPDKSSPAGTSAVVSADKYSAPGGAMDVFGSVRLAATDLACVAAATVLHHPGCRAGYRTVVFGVCGHCGLGCCGLIGAQ